MINSKIVRSSVLTLIIIIFSVGHAFAQNRVVVIPMVDKVGAGVDCPPKNGSAIDGPEALHNFCWYLGAGGASCDTVCSDVGGKNLANSAESEWPDSCAAPVAIDVSTWFFNVGNLGAWISAGSTTQYHSLGYGYTGEHYHGKCSSGSLEAGVFPGETNYSATRTLVCPCF